METIKKYFMNNEEKILQKSRETMSTKDIINEIIHGQNKIILILTHIHQEWVSANEKLCRIETDLKLIKLQLQIA